MRKRNSNHKYLLLVGIVIVTSIVFIIYFQSDNQVIPLFAQKNRAQKSLVSHFPPLEIPEYAILKNSFSEIRDRKQVYGATWTIRDKLLHEVMEWIEDEYYPTWIVIEPAEEPNPSRLEVTMKKDNLLLTFTLSQNGESQPVELNALVEYE